jgi:hypothetical protein
MPRPLRARLAPTLLHTSTLKNNHSSRAQRAQQPTHHGFTRRSRNASKWHIHTPSNRLQRCEPHTSKPISTKQPTRQRRIPQHITARCGHFQAPPRRAPHPHDPRQHGRAHLYRARPPATPRLCIPLHVLHPIRRAILRTAFTHATRRKFKEAHSQRRRRVRREFERAQDSCCSARSRPIQQHPTERIPSRNGSGEE